MRLHPDHTPCPLPTVGFYGLGLIGGSMALALRAALPGLRIWAWDSHLPSLETALDQGTVSQAAPDLEALAGCDLLYLCAPPQANLEALERLAALPGPLPLISDVGSAKGRICQRALELGLDRFIGGHPMAGSERGGYLAAKAGLLENACYIFSPPEGCRPEDMALLEDMARRMGALPLRMDARRHDMATAAISHLPHAIAASLAQLARTKTREEPLLGAIAAGGFRDMTRIASSSPGLWRDISLTNRDCLLALLADFQAVLAQFCRNLEEGGPEALELFFAQAKEYRDGLAQKGGALAPQPCLYVEIPDHAGSLASITAHLAAAGISIQNLGIRHNRESLDGSLYLEFASDREKNLAQALLREQGYDMEGEV